MHIPSIKQKNSRGYAVIKKAAYRIRASAYKHRGKNVKRVLRKITLAPNTKNPNTSRIGKRSDFFVSQYPNFDYKNIKRYSITNIDDISLKSFSEATITNAIFSRTRVIPL